MELTEILVAVKQPDLQISNPLANAKPESIHESSRSGKTFSELLAGLSSGNQTASVQNDEKTVPTGEKTLEKDEKVSSTQDSKKENPKEKVSEQSKQSSESEQVSEETEETSSAKELYPYASLNLVREENMNASGSDIQNEENLQIGQISDNLLDKLAGADDEERIRLLSNGGKVEVSDDFEFEIVSDEALALDSAQKGSVENPLDFLNSLGNETETAENQLLQSKEKTSEESSADKLKSKFTVTDMRTGKNEEVKTSSDPAEPKLKVTMTGNDSATVEMNLNQAQNQNLVAENVLSSNAQVASSDGSNFSAMLQNQIQANASEIVKAGNFVIKDNNQGTIDLVLHPDDIGNVKMSLSLEGDKITGHIVVNTKEALEVFKNNAESLREAFIKNGYENASFEVSYNSSGNSAGQHFAEQAQDQNNFFARREYGSLNQVAEIPSDGSFGEEISDFSKFGINIVA